uniref:CSON004144 protein n=1 Tax=Culicoides sonorensis TaxID=179676 RepID=A0A336LJ44_CULSO
MGDDSTRTTVTTSNLILKWSTTQGIISSNYNNNNNYPLIPSPLIQPDFLRSNASYINNDTNRFNSDALLILFVLYAIVIFGGIFGNASLAISICAQKSGRLRKPLLFALCVADLLVVGVSAPLSIVLLSLAYDPWPLQVMGCKAIHYLRSLPVAASTICLLMLSLDRYATVKHPRLSQLGQRRYLPIILAISAWISASIICIPILLAYGNYHNNISSSNISSTSSSITFCSADYGSRDLHIGFILLHTLLVFIVPGCGVLMNHLGVRKKLCALSLTARAAHGELPLPMPILRRPTHMIIVTGMANAARAAGVESSDDELNDGTATGTGGNGTSERKLISTRLRQVPRTPRSIRRAQEANNGTSRQKVTKPSSDLPLPQTSTLRSRRRLANILVGAALIFILFWIPHVICLMCYEFGSSHNVCTKTVAEFSLLLGYAHSAISPILYWTLNHNSLRQSCCAPCTRITSAQRVLRSHLRFRTPPPPPSSTNEAALGPFNPRYIKSRPQNMYRPPASSHYLY